MTLFLSADKTIVRGNEIVTFTVSGAKQGERAILMQKGITLFNDVEVGSGIFDSSGVARISWKGATAGKYDFYVNSDCGFWCGDKSPVVSVSVTDSPCDPSDILCTGGGLIERQRQDVMKIMLVAVVVIIIVLFFLYAPRKR